MFLALPATIRIDHSYQNHLNSKPSPTPAVVNLIDLLNFPNPLASPRLVTIRKKQVPE